MNTNTLRQGNILNHHNLGRCKVLGIHANGYIHICDIENENKQRLVNPFGKIGLVLN